MSFLVEFLVHVTRISTTLPKPSGDHQVGVLPFRFPGAPFAKIFYPATKATSPVDKDALREISSRFGYNVHSYGAYKYCREKVVEGFHRWMGTSKTVLKLSTGYARTPFKFLRQPHTGEKFPVVVFSHGLGGNADIYSKVCGDLASHGFIVIAIEHEDGSGTYAQDEAGNDIFYQHPEAVGSYTRQMAVSFRGPQLRKRVAEYEKITEFLKKPELKAIESSVCPEVSKQVFENIDTGNAFLCGHSFGGASAITYLHHAEKSLSPEETAFYKRTVLLDPWPEPVDPKIELSGISTPSIALLSDWFAGIEEVEITKRTLVNSAKEIACLKGTTHSQYSDAPWFTGSSFLRKKLSLAGELDLLKSQKAIVKSMAQFLQEPENFSFDKIDSHNFSKI